MAEIQTAIETDGVALVELLGADPEAKYLQALVAELGDDNVPLHDSRANSVVWDIKSKQGGQARSHTSDEFVLHTDGSFEPSPPKLMALQCLTQDKMCGGLNQLVSATEVFEALGQKNVSVLQNTEYTVAVPPEFYKGSSEYRTPLLSKGGGVRYRHDIIDRDSLGENEHKALSDLDSAVRTLAATSPRFSLPEGTVLIFDNTRFLHSRTEVRDTRRHLKRVRFQSK